MAIISLARKVNPGVQRLKIISIDEKFGPSGFPYLTMQLKVVNGDSKGATFSDMLSLSPQARFRVVQFLDAIQAPLKGSVDSSSFVGKYAWGEIGIDDTRETPQPRVMKWLEPPDTETDDEEEEDLEGSVSDVVQSTISELVDTDEEDSPFAIVK